MNDQIPTSHFDRGRFVALQLCTFQPDSPVIDFECPSSYRIKDIGPAATVLYFFLSPKIINNC